jgi:ferredoxin
MRFLQEIGYSNDVSDGIVRALKGSGIPDSSLAGMIRSMAGRWEVGHDAGLQDLARAVEVELAQTRGKVAVKFHVLVPHAGGRVFECEGLEGMSLRDVREHGGMKGGAELSEYIECACSGVMACSTCHVVVDPEWYGKFDPPQTPEQVVPDPPKRFPTPPPSLLPSFRPKCIGQTAPGADRGRLRRT